MLPGKALLVVSGIGYVVRGLLYAIFLERSSH